MSTNLDLLPSIELTAKMKDLTNYRQGKLTFLKPSKRINNRVYWWVKCDCGEIEEVRADAKKEQCDKCTKLRIGQSLKGKKAIDLTNQKFGKLTALFPLEERKNSHIVWHCQCECGNETDVETSLLTSGNTKSCGCLRKEKANFTNFKEDLVEQKFGYLTVVEETSMREYEKVVWKCQCDCGKIVCLNTSRLKSGNDISCGCKKQSLGVLNIIKIFQENNIIYKQEYTELSLQGKRFDFAIYQNNELKRLIEFDGEQHYRITGGWNDKEHFEMGRQRDQEKNAWAKKHNIPLVRIPYWERDNITLDMILGNKYLVDD